jgi:hypothetical protein
MFTATKVASNPKHWKPFGSPVYLLDNDLQGQGISQMEAPL